MIKRTIWISSLLLFTASSVQAQTLPNSSPSLPQPVPAPVPIAPPPIESPPPPAADLPISIARVEIVGSTIFTQVDFAAIVQPYLGRSVTLADLQQAANQITQLYLDRGYITSRAILPNQTIANGVVRIQVIEGRLEAIEVEGTRRLNPNYVRDRLRLGSGTPLNQAALEDQLRLLRIDPLFDEVTASLRAGSEIGQSVLVVRVTEADPWIGRLSVDNDSSPNVGSERVGIELGYQNLTGNGDTLQGAYSRSTTGGSTVFDFRYQMPLNSLNGTLQLRAISSAFQITRSPFARLDIRGNAQQYEISFRQPIERSPTEEFALSIGFTYRNGQTFISDTRIDDSTTSVIQLSQDYLHREAQGAWAVRSQFNIGTGLLDASDEGDPNGQFVSWLGQVQRVQIFDPRHLLIIQLDAQLTPDALLPSQQFAIGGGRSLRGYRQNARLGDNGLRLSIEDRIALAQDRSGNSTFELAPFVDFGTVWNSSNHPNRLPRQTTLAGIGLGLLWEPVPQLEIRLDYALPLVNLDDRGENLQDDGGYFSINYRF